MPTWYLHGFLSDDWQRIIGYRGAGTAWLYNFTFLTGASHPAEMVAAAAQAGWRAIGIADVNSLAGMVRAHMAARDHAIRLLLGSGCAG